MREYRESKRLYRQTYMELGLATMVATLLAAAVWHAIS
ncbi:hypothetical protein QO002_001104 [Pararhizobium capsulatum DSM 1112]|uniref:Uncharacterized protein n=1 Tax=Pararhizobium capsulatum DSM 1112 TaxID=1121113 RepID=A0ABU0BMR6_9HYPH|nr:hypothetical protein [Pararhizobium capsulatum DSM 1112]